MPAIAAAQVKKWLQEQIAAVQASGGQELWVECEVALPCYWLSDTPEHRFGLAVQLKRVAGSVLAVAARASGDGVEGPAGASCLIPLHRPLPLSCTRIPKPWGQEIWYTGVEERGVCHFEGEGGQTVPLPWLLETLSATLTGGHRELILLKILDPLPAEVWGDLYFELHEEKREVYVVTRVDKEAWPDGIGAIRFGFDTEVVARYPDEVAFKDAYRDSIAAYEHVRREIDGLLDQKRQCAGLALNEAVSPQQLQDWQAELPGELMQQESTRRHAMEAFTRFMPLRVGDVVRVPCFTPHSLQHGVRTVEFQTPVYERKILSFAQKVLTQGHWDTDEAVSMMQIETAEEEPLIEVDSGPGVRAERIVDFDDFEVQRWQIQPGSEHRLLLQGRYALVMTVEGEASINGFRLMPESACLIPVTMPELIALNPRAEPSTLLVAIPSL